MLMARSVSAHGGTQWYRGLTSGWLRQLELWSSLPGGDRTRGGPESITQAEKMGFKDGKVAWVLLRAERSRRRMGEGVGPGSAKAWAENAIPAHHS